MMKIYRNGGITVLAALVLVFVTAGSLNAQSYTSDFYLNRAYLFISQGKYIQARDALNEILEKTPLDTRALIQRGIVNERLGNDDKAMADYRAALRINSNSAEAIHRIANLDAKNGIIKTLPPVQPIIAEGQTPVAAASPAETTDRVTYYSPYESTATAYINTSQNTVAAYNSTNQNTAVAYNGTNQNAAGIYNNTNQSLGAAPTTYGDSTAPKYVSYNNNRTVEDYKQTGSLTENNVYIPLKTVPKMPSPLLTITYKTINGYRLTTPVRAEYAPSQLLPYTTDYTTPTGIRYAHEEAIWFTEHALALCGSQRFEEAIKDFDQAVKQSADYAVAYNNRGIAYLQLGEREKALLDFNKALKLNPYYYDARFNRDLIKKEMNPNL